MTRVLGYGLLSLLSVFVAHDEYTLVRFFLKIGRTATDLTDVGVMVWLLCASATVVALYFIYKFVMGVLDLRLTVWVRCAWIAALLVVSAVASDQFWPGWNSYLWPVSILAALGAFGLLFGFRVVTVEALDRS
jgi:hypothetical protein